MKPHEALTQTPPRLQDLPEVIAAKQVVAELQSAEQSALENIARMTDRSLPNPDGSAQAVQRALAAVAGANLVNDEARFSERLAQERGKLRVVRAGLCAASEQLFKVSEEASRRHMASRAPQLHQALQRSIEAYEMLIASVDLYRQIHRDAAALGYWSDSGGGCAWGIFTRFDEDAVTSLAMLKKAQSHCELVMSSLARNREKALASA